MSQAWQKLSSVLVCTFFFCLSSGFAQIQQSDSILGTWRFTKYKYQGQVQPAPNSDLLLTFTFYSDLTSRLFWKRQGEEGFCERIATYSITQDILTQKTIWLNPKNHSSCGKDPDMRPDQKSMMSFLLRDNELIFVLELSGEPFYYILEPYPNPPPAP